MTHSVRQSCGPVSRPLALLSIAALLVLPLPADALSLGDGKDGGLDVGVSVGGDSVADVDVGLGPVDADATVGGKGSIADVDVGLGQKAGASASVGAGSTASASAGIGGLGAGATVLGPNGSTTACVGAGCPAPAPTAASLPGAVTGAVPPAAAVAPAARQATLPAPVRGPYLCAAEGNTSVLDGLPVIDRQRALVGYVHSARLAADMSIESLRIRTTGARCATISGGGLTVAGQAVQGSFSSSN